MCGLVHEHPRGKGVARIVAESAAMQEVLVRAAKFARAHAPVVVYGESGTGKEVVARALHASGPRAQAPFIAVNVAALPAELLESELFGHAKGAFTGAAVAKAGLFEAADRGTLFLDEIAEMPLPSQAKLLRALQDGEVRRIGENRSFAVDVRIICATHRELAADVEAGRFRADLFFRLKVLSLRVPPLRERRDDIVPLVERFLVESHRRDLRLSAGARASLLRHAWPGNVRELQSAVLHAVALADDDVILPEHLPEELDLKLVDKRAPPPTTKPRTLAEVERDHVLLTLDACGGAIGVAAEMLGISRNTLWRKLKALR